MLYTTAFFVWFFVRLWILQPERHVQEYVEVLFRAIPLTLERNWRFQNKWWWFFKSRHSRLDYCNSVLYSLPWSRLQLLQSVLNSAARLIRGLKRFDPISPVLIDLHWLPYPQRVKYKVYMLMFKCLKGLALACLVAFCTKGSSISGWSALRSAVRGGSCCA